MNQPKPRPRIEWIDQVKGLAIVSIVLFHFFQNYPQQVSWVAVLNRNGARLGYAAVDIFFVMAGFNIALMLAGKDLPNWTKWLKKRLVRLYPTYWLAVVACIVLFVGMQYRVIPIDLSLVLTILGGAGYTFQALNPGFWFFTVILQAYLVMPLLFPFGATRPERWLWLGLGLGLITKIVAGVLGRSSPFYLYFLQTNFIGSYIFPVCLGLYWGMGYADRGRFTLRDWQVAGGVFGAGLLLYGGLAVKGVDIVYMLGFDMAFSGLMFLGLYQFCQWLGGSPIGRQPLAMLSILGLYSYQIYLVHQPLFFVMFPVFNKAIGLGFNPKVILSFGLMGLLLGGYVYGFSLVDKIINRWVLKRLA
jgi:peptidoglycan/LPS O-acetylase OafA/YrhL